MESMGAEYDLTSRSISRVWDTAVPHFDVAFKALLSAQAKSVAECSSGGSHIKQVTFADYGCATAGNSLNPFTFLLDKLLETTVPGRRAEDNPTLSSRDAQSTSQTLQITLRLTDQASNDWNKTTLRMSDFVESYLRQRRKTVGADNIHIDVLTCGKSFYEQVFASKTVDFGFSLVASHWLSKTLGPIPTGIMAQSTFHTLDRKMLSDYERLAAVDWNRFLSMRAEELKVGGVFLTTVACRLKNGKEPWADITYALWQSLEQLLKEGLFGITREMLDQIVLPCSYRTKEDILAADCLLNNVMHRNEAVCVPDSPTLEVISVEYGETPCLHLEQFEKDGNKDTFANAVADAVWDVCYNAVKKEICGKGANSKLEFDVLIEESKKRLKDIVRQDSPRYELTVGFYYASFRRVN